MGNKFETYMPPNQDSLKQHILWANYQAAIHRRALEQFHEIPDPAQCGWRMEDEDLVIRWGDLLPAPDILLAATQCSCKKKDIGVLFYTLTRLLDFLQIRI